jgi:Domain of unknown function (DUF4129)
VPGRGARGGVDARRAAAVLLLVAAAAVGLRAGGAFSGAGSNSALGLSGHLLYWSLTAVEVLLALAGVVILVARLVWVRGGGKPRERKRRSIWWLLLLPLAVFGVARVIAKLRVHWIAPHAAAGGAGAGAGLGAAGHRVPPSPTWPVLVVFAVVAVAAFALTLYRRRPADLTFSAPAPAQEPLAEAVTAGEQALLAEPDPRTAIIGCYAAMERSLADAGSPAGAADTPAEVLARATAGGLVRSSWAGTLTGLFRRARYSSHPMTESDRTTALGALAQVRADLGSET